MKDLSAQQNETEWNQTVKNLFHILNPLFTSVGCSDELITSQLILLLWKLIGWIKDLEGLWGEVDLIILNLPGF